MSVIIILLIASLSVALLFLGAFVWSVKDKQFEDGYSPPLRILFEDALSSEMAAREIPQPAAVQPAMAIPPSIAVQSSIIVQPPVAEVQPKIQQPKPTK